MLSNRFWSYISKRSHDLFAIVALGALCVKPESVTPSRRSAQTIDSSLFLKNFNEPMGAPAIFEKQIETKRLHLTSTEEITEPGRILVFKDVPLVSVHVNWKIRQSILET